MRDELDDKITAAIMTVIYFLDNKKELTPGDVKGRFREFYARSQKEQKAHDTKKALETFY